MTRRAYLYFAPEQAGRMAGSIGAFLDAAGDTGTPRPRWQDCLPMIERILSNELDSRSMWAHPKSSEDLFEELLPWTKNVPKGQVYEEFYTEVIIRVTKDVNRWIETFLPSAHGFSGKAGVKKSWIVWYVRAMGRDILIEEGPDFRILDWHERMANGEWKDHDGIFMDGYHEHAESFGDHRERIEGTGDELELVDTRTHQDLNRSAGKVPYTRNQRERDDEFYRTTAPPPQSIDKIIGLGTANVDNKE